jgi:uncharacterized Zn finger protein (UPF0148 family)
MPTSFPCIACGAPVVAEPGAEVMPCPYCDTTLSIPLHLRRAPAAGPDIPQKPRDPFEAAAQVRLDEKARERSAKESELLSETLRRAQPIAAQAAKVYNFWVLAKYYLPGILIGLVVLCLLSCAAIAGITIYFAQR